MNSIINLVSHNPIASIALVSLLLPILIHLFNPNRGKTILVGSLQLLNEIQNIKVTEIRIRQWLLLMVRLIFLLLLVFILLDLFVPKPDQPSDKQLAFVSSDWLAQSSLAEREQLFADPKLNNIYLLKPGFPQLTKESSLAIFSETNQSNVSDGLTADLTIDALLQELQFKKLLSNNNTIYATPQAKQLSISRNPFLLMSNSQQRITWVLPIKKISPPIDLSISLYYTQDRKTDYQLLRLNLDYLLSSRVKIHIDDHQLTPDFYNQLIEQSSAISKVNPDLIIWLASNKVPAQLMRSVEVGSILLHDSENIHVMPAKDWQKINTQGLDVLTYHQLPLKHQDNKFSLWHNNQTSLVSYENYGQGKLLALHSRFNQQWNNLAESQALPLLLSDILALTPQIEDLKTISRSEFPEKISSTEPLARINSLRLESYRSLLILLVVLVWLLERFLSEGRVYEHD